MQTEQLSLSELIEQHGRLQQRHQQLRAASQRYLDDADELRRRNAQLNQALAALKHMQAELLTAAKHAALGSLVAGVSHQLSTPVGNSLMAASTLQHLADELHAKSGAGLSCADVAGFIQIVRTGTDMLMRNLGRAATLVADFKEIAADRSGQALCTFNLHDLANAIVAAKLARGSRHRMVNHIPRAITLNSYPGALGDVLSELVDNALCHGFSGRDTGTITIDAARGDGGCVALTIEDDGQGICPEHLARIFDPFFTTTLGQGRSGLGLHAAYNLVRMTLRGSVQVSSKPAGGTRFTITLPDCVASAASA
jgi:signal transduction histidine kinase